MHIEDVNADTPEHQLCWACKTKLNEAGQKVCQNCHRWQSWPWKYLNLSNASLAIIAALIGTGLALSGAINSYHAERSVSAYVVGQSLQVESTNLNFRIFVYGRGVLVLQDNAICHLPDAPTVTVEFEPVEAHTVFLPFQTEITPGFLQADEEIPDSFVSADTINCSLRFTNENGHARAFEADFRVSP